MLSDDSSCFFFFFFFLFLLFFNFKFESIVSENVGVMLGLRAKLPTPPPEAVSIFMEIRTPHPTSHMPNKIYPHPHPCLCIKYYLFPITPSSRPVDHLAHKKFTPIQLSLNVPLPHLIVNVLSLTESKVKKMLDFRTWKLEVIKLGSGEVRSRRS